MNAYSVLIAILVVAALFFAGCAGTVEPPVPQPIAQNNTVNSNGNGAGLANPASVNCVDAGYKLELRGSTGVCVFKNGRECEEWVFYRGECTDADSFELVQSPGFVANPKEISYKFYSDGRLTLTEKWLREGNESTLTAWLTQEDFAAFAKSLVGLGFDSFESSYDSCGGNGFAGCPTDMPTMRLTLVRQGNERTVAVYAPADRPEALDDLVVDFKAMFEKYNFVQVDVSGCKLMKSASGALGCFGKVEGITYPITTSAPAGYAAVENDGTLGSCTVGADGACAYVPPSQMTQKLCETSGGRWNECGPVEECRDPRVMRACPAMCVQYCECGEGVGSCPSETFCTSFVPIDGKEVGICKYVQ